MEAAEAKAAAVAQAEAEAAAKPQAEVEAAAKAQADRMQQEQNTEHQLAQQIVQNLHAVDQD